MRPLYLITALVLLTSVSSAQVGSVVPMPKSQWFDDSGNVLASGTITVYDCGTTTPKTTYSDSALSVPNANPLTLDSAGRASIYLSAACHKFLVKTSAGATLYTQDNVYPHTYLGSGTASSGTFLRGDYAWSRQTTVVTTTATGTQNNFDPGIVSNTVILANNASALTISGFAPAVTPWDGQRIWVVSKGAGQVDLDHQDTGSIAANRLINVVTGTTTPLAAGVGTASYVYDASTTRWRLVQHEQGTWITATFSAGNFTAGGTQTWTVANGDETVKYWLKGRTLYLMVDITTSTVGGTAHPELRLTLPFSASVAIGSGFRGAAHISDNGGTYQFGLWYAASGNTYVAFYKDATTNTNWTASTDQTSVIGLITLEVT